MTVLRDYNRFIGRHWETGSVANFFAYRGIKAPHTGEPFSEALLLGISGGIVMGYFTFAYEDYDPQARILTRNTFDPMDTLLSRLGVVQEIVHTPNPDKAKSRLQETLDDGLPAIVWADMFSLTYNHLEYDRGMWAMMPVLVFGLDESTDRVWIADRARVPLFTTTEVFKEAWSRVKKFKHRSLTLSPPDHTKLQAAVRKGIWDCIKLFTEAPPKGSKNNFGLAAFRWWADLLRKPKQRLSWEKEFPAGGKMYAGLTSAFSDITTFGKDGFAERDLYADFLEEAALLLGNPGLSEVAAHFHISAKAWESLSQTLLPDDVPMLGETRRLMLKRHQSFLDQGNTALDDIRQIDKRLAQIKTRVAGEFPLDQSGVEALRDRLSDQVMHIHDIEQEAIEQLQEVME